MPDHAMPVLLVGGGMITHDQLLPALWQLQRLGRVGAITVYARHGRTLRALADSETLRRAFPERGFEARPALDVPADETHPDLWREAIAAAEPETLVVVATPDRTHHEIVMVALRADCHVLCVKPLVQTVAHAREIEVEARRRALFVGIEYHKRFDRRALEARDAWRRGHFGEFRVGEARLVEPWAYRHSNFQNWFTPDQADPFTYIGCHYVDQVAFLTGLRPVRVSVLGVEGRFPNGARGWMWSSGRVVFENGGVLSVLNGLGYPDAAAGSNDQGITLFADDGQSGAILRHNDQMRGVAHGRVEAAGGKPYAFVNPDYFRLVPWAGEGLRPVGYGYDSVEALVGCVERLRGRIREERCESLAEIDARGLIATPANSLYNELVTEAARYSIAHDGAEVRLRYGDEPGIALD